MKIAQLTSNFHTVAPTTKAAIYSHIAWLTNGLVAKGHEVHLFASGDSETQGILHAATPTALSKMDLPERIRRNYVNLLIANCYEYAKNVDIIHSHFNVAASFFSNLVDVPTIHSIHSPIDPLMLPILEQFKNRKYVSFSLTQRKLLPSLNWVANIYHGVDIKIFSFNPEPQNYFLYLGRITKVKGVHLAIEAAKAAGVPLIIVGKSYPDEGYWHDEIEQHINGKTVRYVGEADFEKKIEWLRNAKALLFPTQWDEPFGYAMIEAMACGTPVIGWKNGSVPEVVSHGNSGFVVDSVSDMVAAIQQIDTIDRKAARKRAELYFSVEKMVSGYEKVYKRIIEEHQFRRKNGNGS